MILDQLPPPQNKTKQKEPPTLSDLSDFLKFKMSPKAVAIIHKVSNVSGLGTVNNGQCSSGSRSFTMR